MFSENDSLRDNKSARVVTISNNVKSVTMSDCLDFSHHLVTMNLLLITLISGLTVMFSTISMSSAS